MRDLLPEILAAAKRGLIYRTGMVACALLWSCVPAHAASPQAVRPYTAVLATNTPLATLPPVPDMRPFTVSAIEKMQGSVQTGRVTINKMYEIPGLLKFVRSGEFGFLAQRQGLQRPEAIYIHSGTYDLPSLTRALNRPDVLRAVLGGYLLQRPLYINNGATLMLDGGKDRIELKLSLQAGAFIVNGGKLIATHAAITGWDVAKAKSSTFRNKDSFRPFYTAWSGSETYVADTRVAGLGYSASKAYGFSLSSDPATIEQGGTQRPTGWIIHSSFTDMYYGFYTYEADDVVLLDNIYRDNIVYGIDPHDRSRRLLIARNDVSGTKEKHGIIVSRNVDDSWIVGNVSHDNHSSGIMLDRSSRNNLVARNVSKNNGAYGIALLESPNNIVTDNDVSGNGKDGLRVRNAWDVTATHNRILNNKGFGVIVTTSSIATDARRDFKEDPYTMRSSLDLRGGKVSGNRKAAIRCEGADRLRLDAVGFDGKATEAISTDPAIRNATQLAEWLAARRAVMIAPVGNAMATQP